MYFITRAKTLDYQNAIADGSESIDLSAESLGRWFDRRDYCQKQQK